MYGAFFDELEKVALSRGGKPYKKSKPDWGTRAAIGGGLLAAGILGYARVKGGRGAFRSSFGSGYGSRYGSRTGRSGGRAAGYTSRAAAKSVYSKIPDLKKAKTKAQAKAYYRAAARANHPDAGGSTATMQGINSAWNDFTSSSQYSKMAMVRWVKQASVLCR